MYKMLILMLLVSASSTGCASDCARLLAAHKESQDSAILVRRFYDDVWNEGRADAAEKYLAPDFVRHDHRAIDPGARLPQGCLRDRAG